MSPGYAPFAGGPYWLVNDLPRFQVPANLSSQIT